MQSCSHLLHGRPGVPSLAAPPAGLGRPRSNTTYPAPARPPAPAVSLPSAADRRLGSPPKSPAACTHSRIFKNKQAPSPSRGVRRVFAKPAPPEAGKFAGRARAGRACCHPLLATRQPRRAPRPYSPPRERSPSLRVTPSPAMQCQDCTTLTHRLSSQLEKKKKKEGRERERARGNSEGGGLAGVLQRIAQLELGAPSAQWLAGARGTAASRNQLYHFISTTVSGRPLRLQAPRRPLPATK